MVLSGFSREEAVSWWCDVCVAWVGEDCAVESYDADADFVGGAFEP